ncbi:MAG: MFS transporter [Candidatus Saliniplasma sp.]
MANSENDEPFGVKSVLSDLKIVLKYKQLSILCFAVFVSMIGFGLIMPFLPIYARDFGASRTEIGLMLGLFSIVKIFIAPIGGKAADMYGRKPIMVFGMFMYVVVMFLFGTAGSVTEVLIYRAGQGAASGLVWPVAMTFIGDIVKEEDRGKAMGIYSVSFASGNATGPIMGGVIASYYSLSVPFFFTSALAAVSGILLYFGIQESFAGTKSEVTKKGRQTFAFLKFKLSNITPHPKTFMGLTIGSFTVFFGLAMVWPMLSLFGDEVLLLSDLEISGVFTMIGIVQALIMFPAGSLSDRIGRKTLIVVGGVFSSIFAGIIGLSTSFIFIMGAVAFYTLGRALARPSFPAFVSSLTPTRHRGKGMGVYNFAQNLAFASGSFLSGVIADMAGLRIPFFVALFVGLLGVLFIHLTVVEPDFIAERDVH